MLATIRTNFRIQLLVMCLAIGMVPLVIAITLLTVDSSRTSREQVSNQLVSLSSNKSQQIHGYLGQIRDQVLTLSENAMTIEAMEAFSRSFRILGEADSANESERQSVLRYYADEFGRKFAAQTGEPIANRNLVPKTSMATKAQALYIAQNPEVLGEKDKLNSAGDGSEYSKHHARFHPIYRNYLRKFGYYDIFLIEPSTGHIVYSVFKEIDFGSSLLTGPFKDTNFARAFREAASAKSSEYAALEDFESYLPSYNAAASFIASPIFKGKQLIGVLAFQMPVERINTIMQQSDGLGQTGEAVLMGADRKLRSQSRLTNEPTLLKATLDHDAALAAARGASGVQQVIDANGESLLVSFSPLHTLGVEWSVLSSINAKEAFAAVNRQIWVGAALMVLSLVVVTGVTIWYVGSIRRRLGADPERLEAVANTIASGNFEEDLESESPASGVFASMRTMQRELRERVENERRTSREQTEVISDIRRVLSALSRGDFCESITRDYVGPFVQLKADANATVEHLRREKHLQKELVDDLVHAARSGNVSTRIDLADKTGFFRDLATSLNQLMEATSNITADTSRVIGAMASGDLSRRVTARYEGDFDALKQDVNRSVERIVDVIDEIRASSGAVAAGARSLSRDSDDLAQRTEEQSASLQSTAKSMESITATVRQSADHAEQASLLAEAARTHAVGGGEVVAEVVSSMRQIQESSNHIADIIAVIDEIAFQTNLLALNAAVEAARAGEQGRGFAVVASEVRNLAGRSAEAAKEIKSLIEDSVSKVEMGSSLVDKSGGVLQEIIGSVDRVSTVVAEIAAASRQQSLGIDEVNRSVAEMETTTQGNAAVVDQAARASGEMGEQAEHLKRLIAYFRTEGERPAEAI